MIRVLAPTGAIGLIPEDSLAAALAEGAVILTPEKMRDVRQAIFMQHEMFKEQHRPPEKRRKSLWRQRSR